MEDNKQTDNSFMEQMIFGGGDKQEKTSLPSDTNNSQQETEGDFWDKKAQEKTQKPEKNSEISRTNLILEEDKTEEDQGLLGIAWDAFKSGIPRTRAGLQKFIHETNYNKHTYKDIIKEYGSIEKAMEAEDPRAFLAQQYETQDGKVIEGTESLMSLSHMLQPDVEQDVFGALLEGRWEDFVEGAVSGVASNIPDLVTRGLLTAGTGNPWLATSHIFGSVAGQKMIELEDNEAFTDNEKMLLAGMNGSIEYLAESLGTGKYLGKLVEKIGEKPAKKLVFRALQSSLVRFYQEGREEYFTEWAQSGTNYIFSKMKGLDVEWDWGEQNRQANNAGLLGGLTGVAMGGAGEVIQTIAPKTKTNNNNNDSTNTEAPNSNMDFDVKNILEETGDRTFDARVDFVQKMVDTGTNYATELGIDPRIVVALMGQESNFKHVKSGDESSSSFGALQMNDGAMETVKQNYELENDPDSVEGRIEAGVKYLHWIKTNYGMEGDSLVASYYAGVGEIRDNGIHNNKIYGDSASPQEYLNEFHNMLSIVNKTGASQDTSVDQETQQETQGEQEVTEEQASSITPESEQWLNQYFNDNMNNIELKNEQGEWSQEALSEFDVIRKEFGVPSEPIFTDSTQSEFTMEFKKALGESLQDKIETMEEIGMDLESTDAPELLKTLQGEGAVKVETEIETDNEAETNVETEDTSEPIAEDTEYTELQQLRDTLDSMEDKRTSQARELKQKIKDLEFIQEFEKTDETIDEAYLRLEEELEQVDDKRTKEGRELKDKLHALKEYSMRQVDSAIDSETESSSSEAEGTDKVNIRTEINQKLKDKAQEYMRLKAEEGVEVTEEEAIRLMTFNKPANGNAINTTTIDTNNPEVLKLVDEVAEMIKGESEETFKNIEADAEKSFSKEGKALEKELGVVTKDAKVLAKVMQKAPSVLFRFQHLVNRSAEQVTETAKNLNETMSTLSELELANFAKQIQAHFSLTNDLLDIKSGWGRTGVAMKHKVDGKMVDVDSIDPRLYENDLDAQSKVKASIDTLGGAKKLKQMIKDIANGNYDLEGLNQKVRESTNKKVTRAILENMSISVLGQWKTHIANILGQSSFTIYKNLINYSQASANLFVKEDSAMNFAKANAYLMSTIEGFMGSFVNPIVSMNDAGKAMYGEDLSAMELAVLAFKDSKKFETIREASGLTSRAQVEFQRTHNLDMDTLFGDRGKNTPLIKHLRIGLDYINSFRRNTTFGLLQAGDKPFASAGYHGQLSLEIMELQKSLGDVVDGKPKSEFLSGLAEKALAHRKLKQLENVIEYRVLREAGTESQETQDTLRRKIYSELTNGALDNVTPFEMEIINRIDQKAIEHSDEMTWKDSFEEDSFLGSFEKFLNAHPTTKIFGFLFYHTPMKIAQRVQKDTIRKDLVRDLIGKNGKKAQVEAIGTSAVSYGLIIGSALLYLTNSMTGTPRDERERKLMKEAGVPENSVKINGKWLSFDRLEPAGYLLSLGANSARALHEALEDPDVENRTELAWNVLTETFGSMAQTMMNKSSLTGVLRTVNMLVNGGATGYFKGVLEINNPLYSAKRNITDISYGGLNPFFNENYMEDTGVIARDMFGKPITKYDSLTQLNPTEPSDSPIRQELYDLQLNLSGFGSTFNGVSITRQQRNEILRYFDEVIGAEEYLSEYVESNTYQNLSSPQKRLAIERIWTRLKSRAQMQIVKDSEYMEAFKEAKEKEKDDFLNNNEYSETMFREGDKNKKIKDIIERINIFKRGD